MHRFAKLAAYASECAAEQGQFASFVEIALAKQDSFGIMPWPDLAARAGVRNTEEFSRCFSRRDAALVKAGESLAERMDISGTPTLVVNGLMYPRTPNEKTLRKDIDAVLGHKTRPFEAKKQ
jgi:protein-disulfide isomerase